MKTVYVPKKSDFEKYYLKQRGYGVPYAGVLQDGRGFFTNFLRSALPIVTSTIGQFANNMANDFARGKNLKTTVAPRAMEAVASGFQNALGNQSGTSKAKTGKRKGIKRQQRRRDAY